jgi:pimeloyl-ACP methyl ester carboxylesterase
MGAAAKHIAKYTVAYRRLFPSSRIVLIRCDLADIFKRSEILQSQLKPAFEVVQGHIKEGGELLVQSFSNGGGTLLVEFGKLWQAKNRTALPMRAQMIDSAPGKGGWTRSHAAIYVSLPRNVLTKIFGSVAIQLFLFSVFLWDKAMRKENSMLTMARLLNDPELFDIKAPRVYLYSKADAMVGDDEVEEHAEQAAATGRHVITVRFEKSPHAGHIMEDEGKYWGAVKKAWNREGQ